MSTVPLIDLSEAAFGYFRNQKPVVENITFKAVPGEFIVLRGPNGCGKSTILKGMLGLAYTLSGSVHWSIDRTTVGYVPQETAVSGDIPFTVFDIVNCGVKLPLQNSEIITRSALASVEIDDKAHVRFGDLSGGQKRRVLFARALARKPQLLILDEPTANVDVRSESVIERLIADLTSSEKSAVIAVAHAADFGKKAHVIHVRNGGFHE